jgi:hypothetical protein
MIKLDVLEYDTIILGGTLEALIHSYVEGIPLIMVNPQIPFYRDIDSEGLNKSSVWRRLSFYLSYAGLNPIGDKASNYRFDEDNVITIFGKLPYKIEIKYNNIIRYDQIKPTEKLRVFDYIHVLNLRLEHQHILKNINTSSDFINHFLDNIDNKITNIAAVSYLTSEQTQQEGYSEIYARLKTVEILEKNGILGFIETTKDKNLNKLHKIKTKTIKREILHNNEELENLILSQRKQTKNSYLKSITDIFGNPYAN